MKLKKIGETFRYFLLKPLTKLEIMLEFKIRNIDKFEYKIMKEYLQSYEQFGEQIFYQTHPNIKLKGVRPTLCRYSMYGLEKYLNKNMEILDVGSNIGFFSLYVSEKVKSIDLLEVNPKLIKICEKATKYLNIKNTNSIHKDIKTFKPTKKYDIIFSFAVHDHIGMNLEKYLALLHSFLKKDGIVLIESHPRKDINELEDFVKNKQKLFEVIENGITDDNMGKIRAFFYLKKREV